MSKKVKEVPESKMLADLIVEGMKVVKAHDIRVIDLSDTKCAVSKYFVICHGESNTQVQAISRSIEREISRAIQEKPWHSEGKENAEWILLDYVDVVAHIFYKEAREFYNIEALWADAPTEIIDYQV